MKLTARKQITALWNEHMQGETQVIYPATPSTDEIMKLEPPEVETDEQAAALSDMRSKARSLKGALIYICLVHPAVTHDVSRVCALMARPTWASYACAKRILSWLHAHIDLGPVWGDPSITSLDDLVPSGPDREPMDDRRTWSLYACVDSDLASPVMRAQTAEQASIRPADRQAARSQLGYSICLAGAAFQSISRRQHSVASDVAAAECFAASSCAADLINITGVLRFVSFGVLGDHPVPLWIDNEACVLVATDASSIKRLAYITRRVRLLQELQRLHIIKCLNVPGTANPADVLTKYIRKAAWRLYIARLYNVCADALRS